MSNLYVRSTDGLNTNSGATWALAKATLAGAIAAAVAGDTIYVSQVHAESYAASTTLNFGGTISNGVRVVCGNDSATPPTAVSSAATVLTTGASNLTIAGNSYLRGIAFTCGNGYNFANMVLATLNGASFHAELCDFILADTHPSSLMTTGANQGGDSSKTKLTNCRFKTAVTNSMALVGFIHINGGSYITGTATPANLFVIGATSRDGHVLIENFDFSNLGTAVNLFANNGAGKAVVRNCKLPAGWTGSLFSAAVVLPQTRAEMYNCDSGDTNYKVWAEDFTGVLKSEIIVVKTGGASDGATPLSWKMVSSANVSEAISAMPSLEMMVWNDTAGTAKTVTVDILHDSLTALTNAEVWIEVSELGTTGFPLGVPNTNKRVDVLTTPVNVATSTAAWTTTGLTNPNTQKVSVTFTPVKKGPFICRVMLGKTSKTIYVDPVAQVA